jgi:hypothetical protein
MVEENLSSEGSPKEKNNLISFILFSDVHFYLQSVLFIPSKKQNYTIAKICKVK